ncbi:MAG: hypothetical protein ACREX9_20460, partial [Gammaproteobacteria bacterium]
KIAPHLLGFAFYLLPTTLDLIPIHLAFLLFFWKKWTPHVTAGTTVVSKPRAEICSEAYCVLF